MRRVVLAVVLGMISCGMANPVVDDMLSLADLRGEEYIHKRELIVQRGTDILPEVDALASNHSDWELSLYASICAEHIRRGKDIDILLNYDWKKLPGTESLWDGLLPLTGIPHGFEPFFRQKLLQDGLWFLYLEIYAGKLSTDSFSSYRLLYETIPAFVVECSQGDIRQMAARIAEKDVLRNTAENTCSSDYLHAFSVFVEDGTYPQGKQYFLSYLRLNGHLRTWALKDISDTVVINELVSRYSDDNLVQIALKEHLRRLNSTNVSAFSPPLTEKQDFSVASAETKPPLAFAKDGEAIVPANPKRRWWGIGGAKIVAIVVLFAGLLLWWLKRRKPS